MTGKERYRPTSRFIKCILGLTTGSVYSSHDLLPVLARLFATER
jgi:hypothetical protein